MNILIVLSTFLACATAQQYTGHCPLEHVFEPCHCAVVTYDSVHYFTQITCTGVNGQQLKDVFHRAGRVYNVSRAYDVIDIREVHLLNICCDDIFEGFKFGTIKITNSTLCVIHLNGFLGTQDYTKELQLINTRFTTNLVDGQQLFKLIRRFHNLRGLFIISTNLEAIPADGLQSYDGHFGSQLEVIRICSSKISKLPDYVFRTLPRVTWLDFGDNYIHEVNARTFYMRSTTRRPIEINLSGNHLTSTSFIEGAFQDLNRDKVDIYVTDNRIDTLYERVFNQLLRSQYVDLHVEHNPFVCDCRHRWLFNYRIDNEHHLKGMTCAADGRSIWTKDLSYCSSGKYQRPVGDLFYKCCNRHRHHDDPDQHDHIKIHEHQQKHDHHDHHEHQQKYYQIQQRIGRSANSIGTSETATSLIRYLNQPQGAAQ